MKIIDVSKYNGVVDWVVTAPLTDFVILRASVGLNKDTMYDENVAALEKLNKVYHAYHYIKALSPSDAREEAKVFANATKGSHPVFYVIDAEYSEIPRATARNIIEKFEYELRQQIANNIRVALYIGHDKYSRWLLDYDRYSYVWTPRYGKNDGTLSGSIKPNYDCDLWQYTSKGSIAGMNHAVDLNVLNSNKPLSFYLTGKLEMNKEGVHVKKGDKTKEVKRMQSVLIALGYDLGKYGADGSFGNKTFEAVTKFQMDHGFKKTGEVDETIYDAMFNALTINVAHSTH